MPVIKTYTAEHHAAIAASRKDVREATNRIRGSVPVAGAKPKRKAKAEKVEAE